MQNRCADRVPARMQARGTAFAEFMFEQMAIVCVDISSPF
jgi:hypothetical protein